MAPMHVRYAREVPEYEIDPKELDFTDSVEITKVSFFFLFHDIDYGIVISCFLCYLGTVLAFCNECLKPIFYVIILSRFFFLFLFIDFCFKSRRKLQVPTSLLF